MSIAGRRALVVGGSRRLGRAVAVDLAARGADVCVTWHSEPTSAADTVAAIRAHAVAGHAVGGDVRTAEGAKALIDAGVNALGGIDVLVYAASSGFERRATLEIDEELFDEAVDSTLKGGFFAMQEARRAMGSAGGSIVCLTDVAGLQPWPSYAAHGAAKAGLSYLVRALARAWAPDVRVNAVAPGTVLPEEGMSEERQERAAETTALGRLGAPEDVTSAVAWLLEAGYVTGVEVPVDGGRLLR